MVETEVRGSGHARMRLRRGLQAQRGAGRINRMFLDFRPVTLLIGRAICRATVAAKNNATTLAPRFWLALLCTQTLPQFLILSGILDRL